MKKKASISFRKISETEGQILKFGGLPYGFDESKWPRSRQTGEPMQFVCQLPFGPDLFPSVVPSVAFLFISRGEVGEQTWTPDGGENAVVIVRKDELSSNFADADVPRLHRMVKKWWNKYLTPETCIYAGLLSGSEDPDFMSESQKQTLPPDDIKRYRSAIEGNKMGGAPAFLQGDELPFAQPWHLLLQLDSTSVPFWINFGDAGIGYAFIDAEGKHGRFLWQCC